MAMFRKMFYRKPPDGLLEISERVFVFDCCFTTVILEDELKVYMGGIMKQLHEYFPEASFMVFNFQEEEDQSQIGNILSEFDMTIMDYPRQYEGCPLLTMETIHHFLRSTESWLSLGHQNVLLLHCESGGWPVLAFMLAALLIYKKQYTGEQKTLDLIYKQAPRELLQLISPLNPLPSQLRYLQYVSRRNVGSVWPPLDRALTLDCVILRVLPNMDGEGGCRPIFRIYGQDPFMAADRTPKALFSTPKRSKSVRYYKQADCELVKIDIHCHIQGDVVLECISLDDDLEREEMMFRVMFNTAFIRSNILMLNRDEIDVLWNSKDRFPKDYRAEVLFSEMDSASSLITIDLPGIEEKGLPIEAFAKVQEIFSNVGWLDPKADVALDMLQHMTAASNVRLNGTPRSPRKHKQNSLSPQDGSPNLFDRPKSSQNNSPLSSSLSDAEESPSKSPSQSSELSNEAPKVVEKLATLPKIVSQRNTNTISSPDSGYSPVQRSPATISRFNNAPSAGLGLGLGISALLHDHPESPKPDSFSFSSIQSVTKKSPLSSGSVNAPHVLNKSMKQQITPPAPEKSAPPPPPPPRTRSENDYDLPESPPVSNNDRGQLSSAHHVHTYNNVVSRRQLPSAHYHTQNDSDSDQHGSKSSPGSQSSNNNQPASSKSSPVSDTDRRQVSSIHPTPNENSYQSGLKSSSVSRGDSNVRDRLRSDLLDQSLQQQQSHSQSPPPINKNSTFTPRPLSQQPSSLKHIPNAKKTSSVRAPSPPRQSQLPQPPPPSLAPPPPPPHNPSFTGFFKKVKKFVSGSPNPTPDKSPPPPPAPAPFPPPAPSAPPPPPPPLGSASAGAPPPPPPPLGSKGPGPPPPPPNGMKIGGGPPPPNGFAPPPPPGKGKLGFGSRMGIKSQPKKASLKPYHWLKITRAMQGSLWEETQNSTEASKAPFDMSELEHLFSANPNPDGKGKANKKAAAPKSEKVNLIELRRAYNCEIMLTKVKVPLPDLMSQVLALDDSALDVDQVDNLIKFCPTKEEMELLKGYKGDKNNLGKCELFFLELMKVPRVESKLRVFSFKIQFLCQVTDLKKNLSTVNAASQEIRNSVKLKRIMQTILTLGNALNYGTARGSAVGFRLDSLLKLTDTRARNNKLTLMHYLCKILAERLPELLDFQKDLAHLEVATKIQLKYLAEEMQALSKGIEKVVQELTASENDGAVSSCFCKITKEFLGDAEAEVRALASLYSGVGRNADALALYFGEDPARCPFEQVVSTLLNFVRMFSKAHDENCKEIEIEKKKAEKEKAKLNASGSEKNGGGRGGK